MKDYNNIIALASTLHNVYEEYSKQIGWKTQKKTQVPFHKLPVENRKVMIKMATFVKKLIDDEIREVCDKIAFAIQDYHNTKRYR